MTRQRRPSRIGLRKKRIIKELLDVVSKYNRMEERYKLHDMKSTVLGCVINAVASKYLKVEEIGDESTIDTINHTICFATLLCDIYSFSDNLL